MQSMETVLLPVLRILSDTNLPLVVGGGLCSISANSKSLSLEVGIFFVLFSNTSTAFSMTWKMRCLFKAEAKMIGM
jgi:hypothetical protein